VLGDGIGNTKTPSSVEPEEGLGLWANLDRLRGGRSGLCLLTLGLTAALALPVAALAVTVTHLSLRHDGIPMVLIPLDAQLVVDVSNPGDRIENVLGQALRLAALDNPREGYLAVLDLDLNTRCVKHAVMG
jgi:hypothetical protein